jgi:hypothetical protein
MRRDSASDVLTLAGKALLRAEEAIALVARATPKNARSELHRLAALAPRRARLRPAFAYERVPELGRLRRELEGIALSVAAHGPLGALHAARAEELELEARLAERVATPGFAALAAARFRAPLGEQHARVLAFVDAALAEPRAAADGTKLHRSDDRDDPRSLVRQLARHATELGLRVRIETRPGQLAVAATGHGLVAIRPGVALSAAAGARITLHELLAHALPRAQSLYAPISLLRAGTAGSIEGEEGRALVVEARAGRLDGARRRELALRHLAALSVRGGADFEETHRELVRRGAEVEEAVEIAVRVQRGGGLAREVVYLPAHDEVSDAFRADPELERWFESGRVGLSAARELAVLARGEPRANAVETSNGARPAYSPHSMNTGV